MAYYTQYTYPAQQRRTWVPGWLQFNSPRPQYYYPSQQTYYAARAPAYQPPAYSYGNAWSPSRSQPAVYNPSADRRGYTKQYAPAAVPVAVPVAGDKKKKVRWGGVRVKRYHT